VPCSLPSGITTKVLKNCKTFFKTETKTKCSRPRPRPRLRDPRPRRRPFHFCPRGASRPRLSRTTSLKLSRPKPSTRHSRPRPWTRHVSIKGRRPRTITLKIYRLNETDCSSHIDANCGVSEGHLCFYSSSKRARIWFFWKWSSFSKLDAFGISSSEPLAPQPLRMSLCRLPVWSNDCGGMKAL